jgi:hypothetical protein
MRIGNRGGDALLHILRRKAGGVQGSAPAAAILIMEKLVFYPWSHFTIFVRI